MLERFGADVVGLYRADVAFGIRNEDWKPWQLFDGTPVEVPGGFQPVNEPSGDLVLSRHGEPMARMPKDGFYFDRLDKYPGAAHADVEKLQSAAADRRGMRALSPAGRGTLPEHRFRHHRAVGPPYELFYGLGTGDFSAWMITFATEPDYVAALYDKLVDDMAREPEAVRAGRRQPCADPAVQRRLRHAGRAVPVGQHVPPPGHAVLQRGLDWIHQNTDMKVFLHSDGALFP